MNILLIKDNVDESGYPVGPSDPVEAVREYLSLNQAYGSGSISASPDVLVTVEVLNLPDDLGVQIEDECWGPELAEAARALDAQMGPFPRVTANLKLKACGDIMQA